MKFIGIGDNCIDYYIDDEKGYPGGNAVNLAVYMKQLGWETSYFGIVGDDENGELIINSLKEKNIDISLVRVERGKTPVTNIRLLDGDRIMGDYDEGVFANFSIRPNELEFIKKHDYIHTAAWGRCENYLKELRENAIISYDFADKYEMHHISSVAKHIDYGFISYVKEDEFIRNMLKVICENGAKAAIATLGVNGSLALSGDIFYRQSINKVEVVDTLGAGDAFIAGFMYGISEGLDIQQALKSGTDYAGEIIQYFGAW